MTRRSRYRNLICPHCHRTVETGQSFLGHTLYLQSNRRGVQVTFQSSGRDEIIVRFAYHRLCLSEILDNCPTSAFDTHVSFESYRTQLQRLYGSNEEGGPDAGLPA